LNVSKLSARGSLESVRAEQSGPHELSPPAALAARRPDAGTLGGRRHFFMGMRRMRLPFARAGRCRATNARRRAAGDVVCLFPQLDRS
jgi:hypothetical protein